MAYAVTFPDIGYCQVSRVIWLHHAGFILAADSGGDRDLLPFYDLVSVQGHEYYNCHRGQLIGWGFVSIYSLEVPTTSGNALPLELVTMGIYKPIFYIYFYSNQKKTCNSIYIL